MFRDSFRMEADWDDAGKQDAAVSLLHGAGFFGAGSEASVYIVHDTPQSDERQTISACRVDLKPECVCGDGIDSFGNRYLYGEIEHLHSEFRVEVSGTAEVRGDVQLPCNKQMIELAPYRFASQYTRAGDALKNITSAMVCGKARERPHLPQGYCTRFTKIWSMYKA